MTRRRYTEEQKLAVVREAIETGNCAVVGRRHGIAENLVSRWVRQFRALGESAFTRPAGGGSEEVRAYRALAFENERLKRLLGEKELEIAVLKDLVKKRPANRGKVRCCRQLDKARLQGPNCLTCCGT